MRPTSEADVVARNPAVYIQGSGPTFYLTLEVPGNIPAIELLKHLQKMGSFHKCLSIKTYSLVLGDLTVPVCITPAPGVLSIFGDCLG